MFINGTQHVQTIQFQNVYCCFIKYDAALGNFNAVCMVTLLNLPMCQHRKQVVQKRERNVYSCHSLV